MGAAGGSLCLEGCLPWSHQRRVLANEGHGGAKPSNCHAEPPWPKTLYLVRHGQSEYNAYYEKHFKDPMDLFDADLTSSGVEEARAVVLSCALPKSVALALTSPLTRAVRTCLLALPPEYKNGKSRRYQVTPLMAEHLEASCDIGRPPAELAAAFPQLDFEGLPDVWWYVPEEYRQGITPEASRRLFTEEGRRESAKDFRKRVDAFAKMLSGTSETSIAAFAHADFFHVFLCRYFASLDPKFQDYWMKNCEVLKLQVDHPGFLMGPVELEPAQEKPEASPSSATASPASDEPKRSPSRAQLALSRLKEEIARKHPEIRPGELQREASKTWKTLSQADRDKLLDDSFLST